MLFLLISLLRILALHDINLQQLDISGGHTNIFGLSYQLLCSELEMDNEQLPLLLSATNASL
jgi:hypothetical protein